MHNPESIICVGLCCLDLVAKSNQFPVEDTDERVPSIDWCLGGNAAHNAIVLAALESTTVYFAGSMPTTSSINGRFFAQEFSKHTVDTSLCEFNEGTECPISMVIINNVCGSRTILHCRRNFPEFSFNQFRLLNFAAMSVAWIHFEGRYNVSETASMLRHIKSLNAESSEVNDKRKKINTSVELEKRQAEFSDLLTNTDVVFLSKEFAQFHGATDKVSAVNLFRCKVDPGATVVCAWGALGCAGAVNDTDTADTAVVSVDAAVLSLVADTLGAGDTFIAGCLHGFRRAWPLARTLQFAAGLAGEKCSRTDGFDRVAEWAPVVANKYK